MCAPFASNVMNAGWMRLFNEAVAAPTEDEFERRKEQIATQLAAETERTQSEATLLRLNAAFAARRRAMFDFTAGQDTNPKGKRKPERDWRTDADVVTGEVPRLTREPRSKGARVLLPVIRKAFGGDPF